MWLRSEWIDPLQCCCCSFGRMFRFGTGFMFYRMSSQMQPSHLTTGLGPALTVNSAVAGLTPCLEMKPRPRQWEHRILPQDQSHLKVIITQNEDQPFYRILVSTSKKSVNKSRAPQWPHHEQDVHWKHIKGQDKSLARRLTTLNKLNINSSGELRTLIFIII